MTDFIMRFFLSNLFISGMIGILLIAKRVFQNILSCRMQYNLWFLLLLLLAVPFVPYYPNGFPHIVSWLVNTNAAFVSGTNAAVTETAGSNPANTADWMNDFVLSVNRHAPSGTGYLLSVIWIAGILATAVWIMKAHFRLRTLERSALPLQNQRIRRLYEHCLREMHITKDIPVYSTAFLKSPVIAGFLKPRIYLPIHLISDYKESDLRYIMLHELQHYQHKDALVAYLMNLAGVIYWFNPFVWYALKEMKIDREVACDTSVLNMLEEDFYEDYGHTLINFAEKISRTPFPFASGLGGDQKQMIRRITNIASYEKPTFRKKRKGMTAFLLTAILLFGLSPLLSAYAAGTDHYRWNTASKTISYVDLSAYFKNYNGSFVLYDLKHDAFRIYDIDRATLRVSPDSTYKIYNALFGLEEGVITPENSFLTWNGDVYPFEAWNADQTLQSAMQASVNWYFQTIDNQLGADCIYQYIQQIGYGNETINGDLSDYWLESSLKISPVEQVELLTELYHNSFDFAPENIRAVKDALRISSSKTGTLYGKTGTGRIQNQDRNGWFTGFAEIADNTYFFATNIEAGNGASGSNAAKITMSILADMGIWK